MRASGIRLDYQLCNHLKREVTLLTLEEIKEIIKRNTPQTWIIALGLKINELDALCYEDINFDTREVTICKTSNYGKMHFFKKKDNIRKLKIPVLLLNKLNRNKRGKIFKDVYIEDYEKYLYAHVMLMQSQNISINLICKNMGFKSLRTFEILFGHLFPQEIDKDFDIFKNISYKSN